MKMAQNGCFFLLACLTTSLVVYVCATAAAFSSVFPDDISMPRVKPTQNDEYICSAKKVEEKDAFIVQFQVHSENNKAHHILLFGCSDVKSSNLERGHWRCMDGSICSDQKIMFAWAKNAPPTKLPKDVGFRVGGDSGVNFLVLEVHYAHPLNESDSSGITLYTTYERQKYIAGIFLLLTMSTTIPPRRQKVHGDVNCPYGRKTAIHPFAYRVHAHSLGVVIAGYKFSPATNQWTQLGKGNPQWPQAFYPMQEIHTVEFDDYLAARCTFNSSERDRWTRIGSTAADEMCNFYIMYYTDAKEGSSFGECVDVMDEDLVTNLPSDSDVPLPRNPLLEEHAHGGMGQHAHMQHGSQVDKKGMHQMYPDYNNVEYSDETGSRRMNELPKINKNNNEDEDVVDVIDKTRLDQEMPHRGKVNHKEQNGEAKNDNPQTTTTTTTTFPIQNLYDEVSNWPESKEQFGQVTAVAMDSRGKIIIFHRAERVWSYSSFNTKNNFMDASEGAIKEKVIVELDAKSGRVVNKWGDDIFFMPHGLSLDSADNVWVTDVALHQVMKFAAGGSKEPVLTLGVRLVPGSDDTHFCKPSSVAVTKNGDFFVADGYCNSRILKYNSSGRLLLQFGKAVLSFLGFTSGSPPPPYAFSVPHKLTLAEDKDLICVADRENGRIQCFSIANGTFHCVIQPSQFGSRLFSVAYSPSEGGILFAVNGPSDYKTSDDVEGFAVNITTKTILSNIRPSSQKLQNPHDIAVTSDGSAVYIVEIQPNRVWKFLAKSSLSSNNEIEEARKTTEGRIDSDDSLFEENKAVGKESGNIFSGDQLSPTLIILAFLAIPVLIMILIAVLIRLKKQGKFHSFDVGHVKGWMSGYKQPNDDKFNLGNFLNPHKGFDRVNLDESDDGGASSDSDVEEFSVQKA